MVVEQGIVLPDMNDEGDVANVEVLMGAASEVDRIVARLGAGVSDDPADELED